MEKEKFEKAIELYSKKRDIEEVLKELKEKGVKLSFISEETPLRGWVFDNIQGILDRYHKEIVDEINEMYNNVEKEIEEL